MQRVLHFFRKLARLLGRKRFRGELDEEMAFHREQAAKEFIAGGMTPEAARYAAMRQFGNATRLREKSHEVVGFRMETVVQDLRFAVRQLRRNPGFAVTAVVILALGMGVSVAIFGFVDAALLQPLPYAQPNRLMAVTERAALIPWADISYEDYKDWKRMNKSFSSLDVYTGTGFLLRTAGGVEPVQATRVSDGFFTTLGVKPMLGRNFLPGEDRPGQAKIVMLSYGTWLKRFGGRQDVVGQTVDLSGEAYTIVGVLPRSFDFAPRGSAEIWAPLLDPNGCELRRICHNFVGVGRLRDGVTMQQALGDMQGIAAQLAKEYPGSNKGQDATMKPLAEQIVGTVRPILLTLLAAAGLLLLIACVNVASLLLVRSESRKREVAVRGVLGAAPARLVRQFVTEGLLLAAAGCAGGVLVAAGLMRLLTNLVPKGMAREMPFLSGVGMNGHTALFAGGIALLAAALLALTPILRLTFVEIREGLVDGDRGAAGRMWRRFGANLVVVELAVAVVLLAGAGLLGKSFYRLLHVELGFDPNQLATVLVMAPDNVYGKDAQKLALYREMERRVGALPGVETVGLTSLEPVACNCNTDWIRIVGKPYNGEHNEVDERDISPAYFPTLKARLVRGRLFREDEDATKPQVIVINEALARRYFPGEDPIGQKIGNGSLDPKSLREIVGVVADVREGALDDPQWPAEYQELYYSPDSYVTVVVRTEQEPGGFLPTLVSTLHGIDPNLGVMDETTMNGRIGKTQTALLHRFSSWLVGGFAAMALVLGVVGLYGVIAYSVSQRTREIGVRMALGAQRSSVYRMVLKEAGRLIAVGVVVGLAGSVAAAMLMRKLLFGVAAWDAPTLIGVAAVLSIFALLASYIPARRAARVNPTEALRAE
jgi:macrolide transport system ATP-binding/permease protein